MRKLFSFWALIALFSSCCIEGKLESTRAALSEIRAGQKIETERLSGVNDLTTNKRTEGNIDSVIENRVMRRIIKYEQGMQPVSKLAAEIDTLLTKRREFRKKYRPFIRPSLDSMKKQTGQYSDRLKVYMMIEDALNISKYQLFDLAAFFGPGKYDIPADKAQLAETSFAPIIDSMFVFAKKYNVPSTASLVILGFADGTGFSSSGPLFDTLTTLIGRKDASKEELNKKLSELRSKELIDHLTDVYIKKIPVYGNGIKPQVEYIGQGKGEQFPLPSIKDYSVDDARRRIVLCYWAVLPD